MDRGHGRDIGLMRRSEVRVITNEHISLADTWTVRSQFQYRLNNQPENVCLRRDVGPHRDQLAIGKSNAGTRIIRPNQNRRPGRTHVLDTHLFGVSSRRCQITSNVTGSMG